MRIEDVSEIKWRKDTSVFFFLRPPGSFYFGSLVDGTTPLKIAPRRYITFTLHLHYITLRRVAYLNAWDVPGKWSPSLRVPIGSSTPTVVLSINDWNSPNVEIAVSQGKTNLPGIKFVPANHPVVIGGRSVRPPAHDSMQNTRLKLVIP